MRSQAPPLERVGPISIPALVSADNTIEFQLELWIYSAGRYHVLSLGDPSRQTSPLVRIESACTFAHLYRSRLCDCEYQLREAMRRIAAEGHGLLIYALDQHGRGVGLRNHLLVYREEQTQDCDTVEAHQQLGLPDDAREYGDVVSILEHRGVTSIRLLTNNPRRMQALEDSGIRIEREALIPELDQYNRRELVVKQRKLGHLLAIDHS